MDLEQLTKHQILLLTLLVSFVTSMATGIVTVALMDQAPEGVTRVINQIVERTVETVTPSTQGAAVVTTEKTVVVKQDDLIVSSIAAVQKSVVRIVASGGNQLITRGVVIDSKGTAATDSKALAASGAEKFEAILFSGERVPLTVRAGTATTSAIAIVDLAVGTSTGFAPAAFADSAKLTLGQSIMRIGGVGSDIVGEGVIAALASDDDPDVIQASVSSATPGSVLLTIFGEVIGIATLDTIAAGGDGYTIVNPPKEPAEPPVTNATPNT